MKIALAQLKIGRIVQDNIEKAFRVMEEASKNGVQMICFPEVQFYPFFAQYKGQDVSDYEIGINDPLVIALRQKCKELGLVAFPNFYLKEGGKNYDASPVIDAKGDILGVSKMVHVCQVDKFYEQDYYTPSDSGFKVYDTLFGKVGIIVCYDRHYPESFRSCTLQGADLIIIPTANTKGEPLEMFEWEMRVSAMQNSVFIAMCNRSGLEGEMDFCGESLVIDPNGAVVAKAGDQEQILYVDIDLTQALKIRNQKPYFQVRRPETYSDLTSK